VPEAITLKLALCPGQRATSLGPLAVVRSFTVRIAQLVTLFTAPPTITQ
jgi:hypothetical protein